ncbi:AMP binding enzyme AMP binding enzyme C terminal domain [Trypanosoma vivax]|nr:AMP binding enzyme AMP binding enzyme C terminal domain [Trypanosoma vivax]
MLFLSRRQLDKVPLASLFSYNTVLHSVFAAPSRKPALVVELPGLQPRCYTYGRLQKDILSIADLIAKRREAVARALGQSPLEWLQKPRSDTVRSVFNNKVGGGAGDGFFSCDVLADDGAHNIAIIGESGYSFVVSLLAAWSLNQMAVPMSVSQKYASELSYILEHSRSRTVLGDRKALSENFPDDYNAITLRDVEKAKCPPARNLSSSSATYSVQTVFDVQTLIDSIDEARCRMEESATEVHMEQLAAEQEVREMRDAQDIVDRLEREKCAEEERRADWQAQKLREQFSESNSADSGGDEVGMCYDTTRLDDLNAVHRRWAEDHLSRPNANDDCLMLYTSGTTARPKGVVHTHASVGNMVHVLQKEWEWSPSDSILHILPMHHIHGLVNVLLCSLASGARCVVTKFDEPIRIARRLEKGDISLVMGVPTMYTKLIAAINEKMSLVERQGFKNAVSQQVRLMISGSSALPVPTLKAFHEVSGHILLERYGMTEVGMALGQPLRPVSKRVPGTVGMPLPTVRAFVYNEGNGGGESSAVVAQGGGKGGPEGGDTVSDTTVGSSGKAAKSVEYTETGRLAISSPSLFDRYWANPEATKKELVISESGHRYFDTGDTVGLQNHGDDVVFTILGRSSVDIIKSSGFKLSALEIEAALLLHRDLFYEVAVVGCKDHVKGECVVAVAALQREVLVRFNVPSDFKVYESAELTRELSALARQVLSYYKCPTRFVIVPEIPRNHTGKVNKKNLKAQLGLL